MLRYVSPEKFRELTKNIPDENWRTWQYPTSYTVIMQLAYEGDALESENVVAMRDIDGIHYVDDVLLENAMSQM